MSERWERREQRANNKKLPKSRRQKEPLPFAQRPVDEQLFMSLTGRAKPVWKSEKQRLEEAEEETRQKNRQTSFDKAGITPAQILRQMRGE